MNLVVILILFLIFPVFFSGDIQWYVELFCYRIMIPITGLSLFKYIPQNKTKYKTLLLCVFLYIIMEAVTGILDPFIGYDAYIDFYIIFGSIFLALYLMSCVKRYCHKSDKITNNNVYLCFHKPMTRLMYIGSLLGCSVGGMSVYLNGYLYTYRINHKRFKCYKIKPAEIEKRFIILDTEILTNVILEKELSKLIDTKAGSRINCIWTLRKFLAILGKRYKPTIWTYLPSTYLMQVSK
jgi:hypothetical protein